MMGAPKGNGYFKQDVLTPEGSSLLEQLLKGAGQNLQNGNLAENPAYKQALEGSQSLLPGGNGFAPIQEEAQRNFQQSTIPSILNQFGGDSKGNSGLNQALAGAGQNLNSSLGSLLAQMRLQASGQTAQLAAQPYQQGLQAAQTGLNTSPFAYQQSAPPFWQSALLGGINVGGKALSSYLGNR
jgi:hypothetical protein